VAFAARAGIGAFCVKANWGRGEDTARIVGKSVDKCHFPAHNIGAPAVEGFLDEVMRESRNIRPKIIVNELEKTGKSMRI
jgi:hypothetical protein